MDRESIKDVVRDVWGAGTQMTDQADWVSMRCPLAQWTHEKGHDATPSFGIHVDENGTSISNCFTCKEATVPFHVLLERYSQYSGKQLSHIVEEIIEDEYLGPRHLPTYDSLRAHNLEDVRMPIDEGVYMDLYESAAGHPYLRERGISKKTAQKLELLFDPGDSNSDRVPRILFPVRGIDGTLYGFSGRSVLSRSAIDRAERRLAREGRKYLKVRDYCGLQKSLNVLGAHLLSDAREVFVVEGLFDYANAHQQGIAGGAVMHSTLTDAQAAILRELNKPAYLLYDNDKAGQDGVGIAALKLTGYIPIWHPKYPEIWLEDDAEKDGGHWLKDPGEMLQEDFAFARENATPIVDDRGRKRYSGRHRHESRR